MSLKVVVGSDSSVIERRKAAGKWLRSLRKRAGLTQKNVADQLGISYYTFIAQIENGHARLPERLYIPYAQVLNVDCDTFLATCLRFYHHPSLSRSCQFVKTQAGNSSSGTNG